MKRKLILPIALLLCGLFLLAGCKKSSVPTTGADTNSSSNQESIVSFGLDDTVKYENICEMSELYAEVLDDDAIAKGWYYYYTDSDKSPANVIKWKVSGENYTTAEVIFSAKNISDKPQIFGDKITAQIFYQENKDSQTKCYNGTVFQQNPGQVEESGEIIMWSTKPVEIAAGEPTNVSFRFNIPKDVYDKIYATAIGKDTGIIETCKFNFGDKTTYVVDLAKVLIPASQAKN